MTPVYFLLGMLVAVVSVIIAIFAESRAALLWLASFYMLSNILFAMYIVANEKKGGISLLFGFFFLVLVSIPAFVQIYLQVFPAQSFYSYSELSKGYLVLFVAQIAFYMADIWSEKRQSVALNEVRLNITGAKFYFVSTWFLMVLCALIIAYIGPNILLLTRAESSVLFSLQGGITVQLIFVGRALSLLVLIVALALFKDTKFKSTGLLLLSSVIFLLFNYPPSLPRFQLFGCAIALSALALNYFNSKIKMATLGGGILILMLIFPVAKVISGMSQAGFSQSKALAEPVEYLLTADFDGFKQITDTTIYMRQRGGGEYRYGENFLGAVLFFVPRKLWVSKPIDSGEIVSTELGYRYTNVSNPLPSEAYISFGYLGVVFVFFGFSLLVSAIEANTRRSLMGSGLYPSFFLYALFMGFIVIILRGSLNGVAPQFGSGFLAYYALRFLHEKYVVNSDASHD